MAIEHPIKKSLGADVQSFPKTQQDKIVEIIDAVNAITDGTYSFDALTVTALTTDKATITKGNVTQQTAITTAVTSNAAAGVITTVSSTLAAGSNATFVVNNSKVTSTSVIMLTVDDSATAGLAKVNVQTVTNGAFSVNITNIHGANAFNNVIKIHFVVF